MLILSVNQKPSRFSPIGNPGLFKIPKAIVLRPNSQSDSPKTLKKQRFQRYFRLVFIPEITKEYR